MKKLILILVIVLTNLGLVFLVKAEQLFFLENKNLILINENKQGEKLFCIQNSLKKLSNSKIEIELLYLPREDIAKKCEDYWIYWLTSGEYREYLWIPLEKEELERCRSLKYGIYKWQIDCKKKTYKEKDWAWYNEKENRVYTRKYVGISFLPIPKDLTENNFFEKICKQY